MKASECLFKFPVLLYDGMSLEKRSRKELESDFNTEGVQPYARGRACIPLSEIVGWTDSWRIGRTIEDVKESGFCCTNIYTKTLGDFICPLKREKFEQMYDEFEEKMEEFLINSITSNKDDGTSVVDDN